MVYCDQFSISPKPYTILSDVAVKLFPLHNKQWEEVGTKKLSEADLTSDSGAMRSMHNHNLLSEQGTFPFISDYVVFSYFVRDLAYSS